MLLTTSATARNVCWRCQYLRPSSIASAVRPTAIQLSLKNPPKSLRSYAAPAGNKTELKHTRNIGIIAHIDAGKTTTTERMLYYSGFTRSIGSVDDGSTVMDYLPAERARGITITSAAITFSWTPSSGEGVGASHLINLIDTPGHADFTFEVERSIRVLDGAVTILDGVAGVEAQTEKVWAQAGKFGIPRVVFVNKLDRDGARFGETVREVASKLNGWPAVVQLPLYETGRGGEETLRGVVDLVERRCFLYPGGEEAGRQDVRVEGFKWLEHTHPELYKEAGVAQEALVELLSEHDDVLVEQFLELGDASLIPPEEIKKSLRKLTLTGDGKIIPVLCGASFRNIGVQPLLDAVIDYLPSPLDRPPAEVSYALGQRATLEIDTPRTCALAFKVVNDPKKGPMVFVRVYSGVLTKAQTLFNTGLQVRERAHRLLQMFADEAVDIDSISSGHIGVILGLKEARTGDTLVSEHAVGGGAAGTGGKKGKQAGAPQKLDPKTMHLRPIDVPPPVFFASLEPYSLSETKNLEDALSMLLREDPSLSISTDPDSGQTLLSGMGELHLEIARDRLVQDLKAKADMGKILIAYRETISAGTSPSHHLLDRDIAGKPAKAAVTVSLEPLEAGDENEIISIVEETYEDPTTGETIKPKLPPGLEEAEIIAALSSGATAALARGPHLGFPIRGTKVELRVQPATDLFPELSSLAAISSAARAGVQDALAAAEMSSAGIIVEPVMAVAVSCDEKDLGKVVGDISANRGGQVLSLGDEIEHEGGEIEMKRVYVPGIGAGGRKSGGGREAGEGRKRVVNARVPLGEMVGYLKHLRAATKGSGTFVMTLEGWERMQGPRAQKVVKEVRGEY
ncbi:P-loop containing nucleoside triphosphate hydrolase protein [Pyronema domesticum]|nr:P-loop containing nucleoside triphosphate hydrolase protein [Pyronema domesticum]